MGNVSKGSCLDPCDVGLSGSRGSWPEVDPAKRRDSGARLRAAAIVRRPVMPGTIPHQIRAFTLFLGEYPRTPLRYINALTMRNV